MTRKKVFKYKLFNTLKMLLLSSLLLLGSCGFYDDDKPVENSEIYKSSELSGNCKIDPDKFAEFFKQDIEEQIECLRTNFHQFSKYVRTANEGTITERELRTFVTRFFKENSETILKALRLVFDLNMILLEDHSDKISNNNIDPFFELLLSANKEAFLITDYIKKMSDKELKASYFETKKLFDESVLRLSQKSLEILVKRNAIPSSLNLKKFLYELNKRLTLKDPISNDLIDSLLILKKIFVGGDRDIITSKEVKALVNIAPNLLSAAVDFIFTDDTYYKDQVARYDSHREALKTLRNLIYKHNSDTHLLSISDIHKFLEKMDEDNQNPQIGDYKKIIKFIKRDLIGGNLEYFSYKDTTLAFSYVDLVIVAQQFLIEHDRITKDIVASAIKTKENYQLALEKRLEFNKITKKYLKKAKIIIDNEKNIPFVIKGLDFFRSLTEQTNLIKFDLNYVEAIFGLKKVILGGNKEDVRRSEIDLALDKASAISDLYFSLRFVLNQIPEDEDKLLSIFSKWQLSNIEKLIYKRNKRAKALEHEDLKVILENLIDNVDNKNKTIAVVESIKKNLVNSNAKSYSYNDLLTLINYGKAAIKAFDFSIYHADISEDLDYRKFKKIVTEYKIKFELFSLEIEKMINKGEILSSPINFHGLITEVANALKDNKNEYALNIITSVLPLKKLFVGGDKERISSLEFLDLFSKVKVGLVNLLEFSAIDFDKISDTRKYEFYLKKFGVFEGLIYKKDEDAEVFTATEVLNLAGSVLTQDCHKEDDPEKCREERVEFHKMAPTLIRLKARLLENDRSDEIDLEEDDNINFTFKNINKVLGWGREGLENLLFTTATYSYYKDKLEKTKTKIHSLPKLNLRSYKLINKKRLSRWEELFTNITSKFKYFRDEELGIPIYDWQIHRSLEGFQETALFHWGLGIIFPAYGSFQPKVGLTVDDVQMFKFLNEFKPLLQEFNLWTMYPETFARNTILLGDLFQSRSDGNLMIDMDEGAEYVSLIFSAGTLASKFMDKLEKYCTPISKDGEKAFDTYCYRDYFYQVFLEDLNYKKAFPVLAEFAQNPQNGDSAINYVIKVEGFARDINDPNLPMSIRDFTLLIGAMINIESTFIRFEHNRDGHLDKYELNHSWRVYNHGVTAIIKDKAGSTAGRFSKSIFYYMVKEMKMPSGEDLKDLGKLLWQCVNWLTIDCVASDDFYVEAKRVNIGTLLYYLVNTPQKEKRRIEYLKSKGMYFEEYNKNEEKEETLYDKLPDEKKELVDFYRKNRFFIPSK